MNRNSLIAIAAFVAAIGIGGYLYFGAAPQPAPPLVLQATSQSSGSEIDTSSVVEMNMGDPEAPVTVIEYASYTCPHCKSFHEGTFKNLKADYIDTGKVHFIYREVYFDRYGLWASMVARCGGEMRFFGITDMIYEGQREWTASGDPVQIIEELRKFGRTAGMSNEELDVCLTDASKAETLVAWYQQNAEADGVRSTPTFVIDGETYSNMSYSEFQRIIDEAIAG